MANSQNTFIQIPLDVTNPVELRRFLDKMVQQLDIAFGNRGKGSFASGSLQSVVNNLVIDVQDLKNGEPIVSINSDIVLEDSTETILCDCSLGNIQVTLPNPKIVFNAGRSKTISISKVDDSSNIVTIVPYSSETIVGESSVELVLSNEIINLITDGINWYLGA